MTLLKVNSGIARDVFTQKVAPTWYPKAAKIIRRQQPRAGRVLRLDQKTDAALEVVMCGHVFFGDSGKRSCGHRKKKKRSPNPWPRPRPPWWRHCNNHCYSSSINMSNGANNSTLADPRAANVAFHRENAHGRLGIEHCTRVRGTEPVRRHKDSGVM